MCCTRRTTSDRPSYCQDGSLHTCNGTPAACAMHRSADCRGLSREHTGTAPTSCDDAGTSCCSCGRRTCSYIGHSSCKCRCGSPSRHSLTCGTDCSRRKNAGRHCNTGSLSGSAPSTSHLRSCRVGRVRCTRRSHSRIRCNHYRSVSVPSIARARAPKRAEVGQGSVWAQSRRPSRPPLREQENLAAMSFFRGGRLSFPPTAGSWAVRIREFARERVADCPRMRGLLRRTRSGGGSSGTSRGRWRRRTRAGSEFPTAVSRMR